MLSKTEHVSAGCVAGVRAARNRRRDAQRRLKTALVVVEATAFELAEGSREGNRLLDLAVVLHDQLDGHGREEER